MWLWQTSNQYALQPWQFWAAEILSHTIWLITARKLGLCLDPNYTGGGGGGCWTRNEQHDSKPEGDAGVCAVLWGCGEAPRLSLIPGAVCLLQSLRRAERRWGEPVGRGLARQGAEVILARGFKARDARVDRLQPRIRTLARLAQNAVTPRRISGGTSKPNEKRKRAVSRGKIKIQR